MKKLLIAVIFLHALFQVTTQAQDFVYKHINPAFGENPYNYNWLLGQAEAQYMYEEQPEMEEEDTLANFQQDLNNQILNEVISQQNQNQFGERGLTEDFIQFGFYKIDVSPISKGTQIRIIDLYPGSERYK